MYVLVICFSNMSKDTRSKYQRGIDAKRIPLPSDKLNPKTIDPVSFLSQLYVVILCTWILKMAFNILKLGLYV